ncbi:hypothetical protein H261_20824 [Paramagnetospirillum caucaseum]|uniref:Uncharacterized protein n=1 Tax=Paramagnetospirillum caucaseum TaxID=1244869 RepID=M3A563_9PROT|nr:hypothetical protein [Paramagnetospirillum caucaseum]EME67978.1 hypothetical protein H261_20824 [Paramagnetospirillum caucaseum]
MTAFRTIAIPEYAHRTLKASAEAKGMSMSELLTELVSTHCAPDRGKAPKALDVRLCRDEAGQAVLLVIRNETVRLERYDAGKLHDALVKATTKNLGQRRTTFRVGSQLIQVFPRGRGVVVSIDAEEIAIMKAIARDLIAELDDRLVAQSGSD